MVLRRSIIIALLWLLGCAHNRLIIQGPDSREQISEILQGRYNYASADCAARILSTNRGAKCPNAILQSHKDSYLLNLCSYDDKHIIIELCQDIRIDSLVIANFEYFSSVVREFRVSVSKKYPPVQRGWKLVGRFLAKNSKQEQFFPVVGATMYSRYLRIDFDTHYGNEFYCLLSIVRIYGKTMMEDFEESAVMGLPRAGEKRGDHMVPIQATIASEKSMRKEVITSAPTSIITTATATTTSQVDTAIMNEVDFDRSSFTSTINLMELFKRHKDFCQATLKPLTPPPDDTSDTVAAPFQENIFKAIYDRLYDLERNLTKAIRTFDAENTKINDELGFFREELGATGKDKYLPSARKSFRARLISHLERRTEEYMGQLGRNVNQSLKSVQIGDRLVFWIAIFGALQIAALFLVLCLGAILGWFRPNVAKIGSKHETHRRHQSYAEPTNQRSSFVVDETEQRVPISGGGYRGASPAKSDLIDTASKPLLLDESEPEIIDATYIPSPLSADNSGSTASVRDTDNSIAMEGTDGGKEFVEGIDKVKPEIE